MARRSLRVSAEARPNCADVLLRHLVPDMHTRLVAVDRLRPAIKVRGAEVLALSQQTAAENRRARSLASVELSILGDVGGKVGFKFGVRWDF